ncbi:hypothetical protein BOTBODRAFT_175389 [Botryobasidium botryosum FD-172 SS1]|uniref:Phytase A n=1 Tax=Botryobasidium botryosum (strain FD-172 SS1) TaxID=930990 RepID=A0A067MG30_BOTB1|nr:hypothetical protein BOTBODRAFT_175389 [Botryobasidium botryosum FD-172 SS1]
MAAVSILLYSILIAHAVAVVPQINFRLDTAPTLLPPSIARNLGPYAPYFNATTYVPPPSSCVVTQVNILERHGARYPTQGTSDDAQATISKIKKIGVKVDSPLAFIASYEWDLGVEDLLNFGAQESYDAGAIAYQRYPSLFSTFSGQIPFVRSTSLPRCVNSATNWTKGFEEASGRSFTFPPLLQIPKKDYNNTLDNENCLACTDDIAIANRDEFANHNFVNLASRLSAFLDPSYLMGGTRMLEVTDVINLMEMCAFDTVAKEKKSPFCDIFEDGDWPMLEYYLDLNKFYGSGYGNPLGPIQGVGYINELLARLTGNPVKDDTNTNRTLTSDPKTFPFDRPMYANFSHDNQITAIVSAMGLFHDADLPTRTIDRERTWVSSAIIPFAGRMVVERLTCDAGGEANVRVLVNDAVQSLDFCEGVTEDGLCTLAAFVESQSFATSGGDGNWDACFATPAKSHQT